MRGAFVVRIGAAALGGAGTLALLAARLVPAVPELALRQIGVAWTITSLLVQL